jgi:hypothetical protein
MSEPENVLARWSRLKRQSASQCRDAARKRPSGVTEARAEARDAGNSEAPAPAFDASSLPPIESIVAGSDIRAFLQKGVPAALTRAALRQAWSSDPAIRDFIGIAENQWDFADPRELPGFGPLGPTDDVKRLVAQALGELGTKADSIGEDPIREGKATPPPEDDTGVGASQAPDVPEDVYADCGKIQSDPALQHGESAIANADAPSRKRHGGAMPS